MTMLCQVMYVEKYLEVNITRCKSMFLMVEILSQYYSCRELSGACIHPHVFLFYNAL